MENKLAELLEELTNFNYASQKNLTVELHLMILGSQNYEKINNLPQVKQIELLNLVLTIFDNVRLNEKVESSTLFRDILLEEKPYWTLSPDAKQLRFWSGDHGPVKQYHIDSGLAKGSCYISIEITDSEEDSTFIHNNEFTKLIQQFGYQLKFVYPPGNQIWRYGYYRKP
jgi:hypothetical protein